MSELSDRRKRDLNQPSKSKAEINRASVRKYHAKFDDIKIRVPKGERELWKTFTENQGMSLQQYLIRTVHAQMEAAGFDYSVPEDGTDE